MSYFYHNNIAEIKHEYTFFVVNILTPLLYEGFNSLYVNSVRGADTYREKHGELPDVSFFMKKYIELLIINNIHILDVIY